MRLIVSPKSVQALASDSSKIEVAMEFAESFILHLQALVNFLAW